LAGSDAWCPLRAPCYSTRYNTVIQHASLLPRRPLPLALRRMKGEGEIVPLVACLPTTRIRAFVDPWSLGCHAPAQTAGRATPPPSLLPCWAFCSARSTQYRCHFPLKCSLRYSIAYHAGSVHEGHGKRGSTNTLCGYAPQISTEGTRGDCRLGIMVAWLLQGSRRFV
jgi:hypothetical protein